MNDNDTFAAKRGNWGSIRGMLQQERELQGVRLVRLDRSYIRPCTYGIGKYKNCVAKFLHRCTDVQINYFFHFRSMLKVFKHIFKVKGGYTDE